MDRRSACLQSLRVTIPAERQFLFIGAATDKSVDFNASPSKIKLRLFRLKHTQKKHTQSAAPHVRNVRNVFLLGGSRGIPKIVVIDVMTSCRSL